MARTIIKRFRVDKVENDVLKTKADMCCLTESELVRMLFMGFIPKEAPPREFYTKMNELNRLGISLDHILAQANTIGFVDTKRLNEVIDCVGKLASEIRQDFLKPDKDVEFWQ